MKIRQYLVAGIFAAFWWGVSSIILWLLLAVTAFASQTTRYHHRIFIRLRRQTPFTTSLTDTPLSLTPIPANPLMVERGRVRRLDRFWSSIALDSTIALIFAAAASGILSLVLPSPSWFRFMIVIMPLLAAWFASRAWVEEE